MYNFPSEAGSYALIFKVDDRVTLPVGRLGRFDFPGGYYLYCGSAHGPGGLAGRLKHHLSPLRNHHWHIDWLRQVAPVMEVGFVPGPSSLECTWSRFLASLPGTNVPAPGFGAADCRSACPAHLFQFTSAEVLLQAKALLNDSNDLTWVPAAERL
ncbi:MAG: GIY-YIG nuclease family protein [Anaerolineae bacterium]|nr:GIY-YIG nuclease family protein [Anaerolineae bacterium]